MTSVTVASVRKQIAASETAQRMQALAALDDRRRAAVLDMLAGLRPNATVDIDALLHAAGARASAAELGLTDADREHVRESLDRLRTEATARGIAPGDPAMYGLLLQLQSGPAPMRSASTADLEQPDPDDDDDAPEPPKRRGVERKPLKRAGETLRRRAAPDPDRAGKRRTTRPTANGRPFLGGRVLGAGADDRPLGMPIDYDRSYEHFRPPWLIDPGTDDETENDDEFVEQARVGA